MYIIDRASNRISAVEKKSFKQLGFAERQHLQEWLAHTPDALGELLIIQKEFSGWKETSERLDLLALDIEGRVVVIELKLDDSGKDVTWQAIKYAAYCSQLKTSQIVEMYRQYAGIDDPSDAQAAIAEFLDKDGEDLVLNPANSQRIILVAAHFRPEVTASVLWLRNNGLEISCVQVTPFEQGTQLLLSVDQIIPVPEANDYMVTVAEKAKEDEGQSRADIARHRRRIEYWESLLEEAARRGIAMLENKSSTKENWMIGSCGIGGLQYAMVITAKEARVQFEAVLPSKETNKAIFDLAKNSQDEIEAVFGHALLWRRMESGISSRIVVGTDVDFLGQDTWPEIIDWHLTHLQKMEAAITPHLADFAKIVRGV